MPVSLTHFGHACIHLELDDLSVLFDPGTYSDGYHAIRRLDAILITHAHQDHFDLDGIAQLLEQHPAAALIVDPGVGKELEERSIRHEVLGVGSSLTLADIEICGVGGEHALVHPEVPGISNIGFLVGAGIFYHPGDALHVPDADVESLALPTGGPWLKAGEAADFLRAVSPRIAVPIHQGVLSRPQSHYRLFEQLRPAITEVRVVEHATPTAL